MPSMVGGAQWPLDSQYHLYILLHASLIWQFTTKDSIYSPSFLNLHLLSSLSANCNRLVAVLYSCWLALCVCPSAILWSANIQIASDINGAAVLVFRNGLLAFFFRSLQFESPLCTGLPFASTMGQMDRSLQYLSFLLDPSPLISPSTIW